MWAETGIVLTLLQWLHSIRSSRVASQEKATIDSYLEWLENHNHQELLEAILESRDTLARLEHFVSRHTEELTGFDDRILEAISDVHSDITHEVSSIKTSLGNLPTRNEMLQMLDQLTQNIQQYKTSHQLVPSRHILRYQVLGNRLAELRIQAHVVEVLDDRGHIVSDRILRLHKEMFPEGFAWAGVLRTQHVVLADTFGTAARVVDLVESRIEVPVAAPQDIPGALATLCDEWNSQVGGLVTAGDRKKALGLANFHYEFAMIHPFIDGNGRSGRLILDQQASFLYRQALHLQIDREEYYRALRFGNLGSIDQLAGLVQQSVKEARQSLHTE